MKFNPGDEVEARAYWETSNRIRWLPAEIVCQVRSEGRYRVKIPDGKFLHLLTADIRFREPKA